MLKIKTPFFKSGLARKLIFYTVLFSSLITLLTTAAQLYGTYTKDIHLIENHFTDIEKVHLKSLTADLWATDTKQLQTHLEGVSYTQDILFLEIRDQEKVWAVVGSNPLEKTITRQFPMRYFHRGKAHEIGTLTVTASLAGVYQRLINQTGIVLIYNGIKTFLVSGFILVLFHLMITRHLNKIAGFASALEIDQLDQPFRLERKKKTDSDQADELDLVVSAIRQMQVNLKNTFKNLADSEQRFQTLAKVAPVGIFRTDSTGNCTYVNEQWLKFSGFNKMEDALGEGWAHAIHPEDRERVFSQWYQAASDLSPFNMECRFQRPDGKLNWVLASAEAELDPQGEVKGYVGAVTDITLQKKTESTIHDIATGVSAKTGEAFFKSLVIQLSHLFEADYVFIGSCSGHETKLIRTLSLCKQGNIIDNIEYSLMGSCCENVFGKTTCFYPDHVQEHFPNDALLKKIGASGYIGAPLFASNGAPLGLIVAISCSPMERTSRWIDILEIFAIRSSAEIERLNTEKALRQSQKMTAIGQLSGGIAHNFNNQLGIIIGYLDLLDNLISGKKTRQWLKKAVNATLHCSALTRQLLSISRRKGVTKESLDLNATINNLHSMIEHAVTPAIEVQYELSSTLWLTIIDPAGFQDALLNLVINARDAMPNGGLLKIKTVNVQVDLNNKESHKEIIPGDYVLLELSDTGLGMSPEIITQATEPFFTTKKEGQGTGLGLTMVHKFVKQYQGILKLLSEPESGTHILIYFPRHQPTRLIDNKPQLEHKPRKGHESILIVDDEPDQLALADFYLSELGYQTHTAQNGHIALEMLQEIPNIDLLFSDFVMPGGFNGDKLAQEALQVNPNLKILLTSGLHQVALRKLGIPEDAPLPILQKPYRKDKLARYIRDLLDGHQTTAVEASLKGVKQHKP